MEAGKKRKILTKIVSNFNHKINPKQLSRGMEVEQEHNGKISESTNIVKGNQTKVAKIAVAHLKEDKNYYTHLDQMEEKYEHK